MATNRRNTPAKKGAPPKKQELAPADLPFAEEMAQDAGAGFESTDQDSYAIPFISILQSNSPQVKKSDGAYIQGAEEGVLYNNVSNEIMEEATVIPCAYRRVWIEWRSRDEGGGFVKSHDEEPQEPQDEDNVIKDTRMHYCLLIKEDGGIEPCVISMASTQIKKSRKWMTVMNQIKAGSQDNPFTPPMYASMFRLTTVPESNDQGSWMGWAIERIGWVQQPSLYRQAKQFHKTVTAGQVEVRHDQAPVDEDMPDF